MIFMCFRAGLDFTALQMSMPLTPGIMMSVTIRRGIWACIVLLASMESWSSVTL